mmetsp:Transcript_17061/g.45473  ORF Transcript_17061/g.45473 Transcript_17061/m.45473 type:complete len:264 (-) Transcript_17061:117-908(-)
MRGARGKQPSEQARLAAGGISPAAAASYVHLGAASTEVLHRIVEPRCVLQVVPGLEPGESPAAGAPWRVLHARGSEELAGLEGLELGLCERGGAVGVGVPVAQRCVLWPAPLGVGQEGQLGELGHPLSGQRLGRERLGVVDAVRRRLPALRPAVPEGAQWVPRAVFAVQVAADGRLEEMGVVELLLRPVGVRAADPQRTALRVLRTRGLLSPPWAEPGAVTDRHGSTSVLVVVRVHAVVPLVLRPERAPESLVPLKEKLVCQR